MPLGQVITKMNFSHPYFSIFSFHLTMHNNYFFVFFFFVKSHNFLEFKTSQIFVMSLTGKIMNNKETFNFLTV